MKVTVNNLSSLQNENTALTVINGNFSTVASAFDNTLSRDGTSPNQMENNLDMNNFNILNLPLPSASTNPVRLQDLTVNVDSAVVAAVFAANTQAQASAALAASYASMLGNEVHQYDTVAAAITAVIPGGVNIIRTLGRTAVNDRGGSYWVRLGSTPSTIRSWHFQNTVDNVWWIMLAGWQVSPVMFSASVTNTPIQDALDYLQAFGVSGGVVLLEPNKVYTGTTFINVWNGLTLDLNGSRINTTLSGSLAYGMRVGDLSEVRNGWVHSIDGGISDAQFCFGPAITLGTANTQANNTVASPEYFAFSRPRLRNLTVSCTRLYCPVIQVMGGVDFIIDNITVPDSSTSSGIHCDWSDVGGITVAAYSTDLQRANNWKTAFNANTAYTNHPQGRITKVKLGTLSVTATGDSGSRAVRLSACKNVTVEDVHIAFCTLPAFENVGGDLGFEYALQADLRLAFRGINVKNLMSDNCQYYGIYVDTYADNIANAIAGGYSPRTPARYLSDIVVKNCSVIGNFTNLHEGIYIQHAQGVTFTDNFVEGFSTGISLITDCEDITVEGGTVVSNLGYGVNVTNTATIKATIFSGINALRNGSSLANPAGFNVDGGIDTTIVNCTSGNFSEDIQQIGFRVTPNALRVTLRDNLIKDVISGGTAIVLPSGTIDAVWLCTGNVYAGGQTYQAGLEIVPVERNPRPSGGFNTRAIARTSAMTSGITPTFGTWVQGDIIEIPDAASAAPAMSRKGSSTWASIITTP